MDTEVMRQVADAIRLVNDLQEVRRIAMSQMAKELAKLKNDDGEDRSRRDQTMTMILRISTLIDLLERMLERANNDNGGCLYSGLLLRIR